MPDRLQPAARRLLMGRIGSKDTAPELIVRRLLHRMGYRYVLHDARLPGRPDLVFPARGKIVFVHGCFWHGHNCGRGFKPATNAAFWAEKIASNQARDKRHKRALRALSWRVLEVWECETRQDRRARLERRLVGFLDRLHDHG